MKPHEARGYLGLELSGAKNEKTTLAVLEFYPREKKLFLLEIYERISGVEDESSDDALIHLLAELRPGAAMLTVNVPLTLPPCIPCTKAHCPTPAKCTVGAVKHMRETSRRSARKNKRKVANPFTPYTQRPIELWIKEEVMPEYDLEGTFEIDETLGGNKGPLTARMQYLNRHIKLKTIETWPKLSTALLCQAMELPGRLYKEHRHLERGAHARAEILTALCRKADVFVYERDLRKISQSLGSFNAFICAFIGFLADQELCAQPPSSFPATSGWVYYPLSHAIEKLRGDD